MFVLLALVVVAALVARHVLAYARLREVVRRNLTR